MRAPSLLASLCLCLLLAGCAGTSTPSGTPTTTGTTGPAAAKAWSATPYSGSFASAPAVSSGAAGAIVSFDVPDGADQAYFNVTLAAAVPPGTPATEFNLEFHDSDHTGPTDTAQAHATTVGGKASVQVQAPKGGTWTMSIYSTGPGGAGAPNQGTYDLAVNAHK